MELPLRYRAPNPPAPFVGRASEKAALTAALRRAAVSVVWGPPGAGKLALILEVLRGFPDERARTAVIDCRAQAAARIRSSVFHVFEALGEPIDWQAIEDDACAIERAVALAEKHRLWMVLRNADLDGDPFVASLLEAALRHAHTARWVATARSELRVVGSAAHLVRLEPIEPEALRALALAIAPDAEELVRSKAIAAASGSPRRLLERLSGDEARGVTLDGLAPDAVDLLCALACLSAAVPRHLLENALGKVSQATVDALVRRGLVERDGDRLGLHPTARAFGIPRMSHETKLAKARALLGVLDGLADPDARVEAIRMALMLGEGDVAARLEAHGAEAIAAGYAEPLCLALADAFPEWRRRAAAAAGNPDLLDPAEPMHDDPEKATLPPTSLHERIVFAAHAALAHLSHGETELAERALSAVSEHPQRRNCYVYRRANAALALARAVPRETKRWLAGSRIAAPEVVEAALFKGDLGSVDAALAAHRLAGGHRWPRAFEVLAARLALLRAAALPEGRGERYARVVARYAARRGRPFDRASAQSPAERLLDALANAEAALSQGELEAAAQSAATALATAEQHGSLAMLLEVLELAVDIALVSDRDDRSRALIDRLVSLADGAASPRFSQSAAFLGAVAQTRHSQAAALHATASSGGASPMAERRARMMLGASVAGDAVDRAVVGGSPWSRAFSARLLRPKDPWQTPLLLDASTQTAVLPNGLTVELSATPLLWRCLEAMAAAGGAIEKGQLYREAWREGEYHPMRHKGRLHTTINKLRNLLEPNAERSTIVVTTEEGYVLAPGQSVVNVGVTQK